MKHLDMYSHASSSYPTLHLCLEPYHDDPSISPFSPLGLVHLYLCLKHPLLSAFPVPPSLAIPLLTRAREALGETLNKLRGALSHGSLRLIRGAG